METCVWKQYLDHRALKLRILIKYIVWILCVFHTFMWNLIKQEQNQYEVRL